ncbi:MAG: transglutaminase domain-containing protein [Candidatus Acidiferrales bacterium]
MRQHPMFRGIWLATNFIVILSLFLVAYSAVWEYSTRRYLEGFVDAVVPNNVPPVGEVEAILNWMQSAPALDPWRGSAPYLKRDPENTLNNPSLLRVCGSATNAFINLANASGLRVRRLLLLNERRQTNHVVAEVYLEGRWVVVDPVFRAVLRGSDNHMLTRDELKDPNTLAYATRNFVKYLPDYNYSRTAQVRLGAIPLLGKTIRKVLNAIVPDWEDSPLWTLILERDSFSALLLSGVLLILSVLVRRALRWYGASRLGVQTTRLREHLRRAYHGWIGQPFS